MAASSAILVAMEGTIASMTAWVRLTSAPDRDVVAYGSTLMSHKISPLPWIGKPCRALHCLAAVRAALLNLA